MSIIRRPAFTLPTMPYLDNINNLKDWSSTLSRTLEQAFRQIHELMMPDTGTARATVVPVVDGFTLDRDGLLLFLDSGSAHATADATTPIKHGKNGERLIIVNVNTGPYGIVFPNGGNIYLPFGALSLGQGDTVELVYVESYQSWMPIAYGGAPKFPPSAIVPPIGPSDINPPVTNAWWGYFDNYTKTLPAGTAEIIATFNTTWTGGVNVVIGRAQNASATANYVMALRVGSDLSGTVLDLSLHTGGFYSTTTLFGLDVGPGTNPSYCLTSDAPVGDQHGIIHILVINFQNVGGA